MPIAIDFETYYDAECSVKTLGNWAYSHHPDWEAYMVSVSDGEETWVGHPDHFNWEALKGQTLVSHNAFFDRTVYRRLVELGKAPDLALDQDWHCSSNLGAYLCGSARSLKDVSAKLLKQDLSKDVRDRAKGKRWSEMVAEGWSGEMENYARRDAQLCWRIWGEHKHRMPNWEHRLSDLTIQNSERGVRINVELLTHYISELQQALFATERTLPWITDGFKPTSPKGVAEQCRRENIPCPPVKDDDEEAFDKWIADHSATRPWVQNIGAWRSLNKTLKRFQLILARLRPDGTMDFGLKFFGAHSGRWSGDAGFNIQNQRKLPILLRDDYTMVTDKQEIDKLVYESEESGGKLPSGIRTAIDERALLIPREGCKFIIADLSQIEPRVLNTLVGNWPFLEKIRGGLGIYEAFARESLGYSDPESLKKKDKRLYALAKAEVLGLGYQCGKKRFPEVAWTLARLRLTEEEAGPIVDQFRANNPKIVALWERLDTEFKRSCGSDFEIGLPSGRSLTYRNIRQSRRIEIDEETGLPRSKQVFTAEVGNRRMVFYGGKCAENATQAVARDVFATHLLGLEDAGIRVPFHVHDEAVAEVPLSTKPAEVLDVMSKAPDWFPDCPVAAEAVEATRYLK